MRFLYILVFFWIALPAMAEERETLYGTWGTEKQCARAPLKPGSLVQSEPFIINSQWIRRGVIWCQLIWFPVEKRENGFFTGASALCGEDTVQRYNLSMTLIEDELSIVRGFPNKHGPLKMYSPSQQGSILE